MRCMGWKGKWDNSVFVIVVYKLQSIVGAISVKKK